MAEKTRQMEQWSGSFGKEYTDRNHLTLDGLDDYYQRTFGVTRTEMNRAFLDGLDRSARILEVGCNVGNQLACLQRLGFRSLYGIELQPYAAEKAKQNTKDVNIIQGSGFDVPYKDRWFDLVFTSGVLIHIAPTDIGKVLDEIHRCSRRYIWGMEYFFETYVEVPYRGHDGLLWKTNFAKLYLDRFPDLALVKEERHQYAGSENVDAMFLLEKRS